MTNYRSPEALFAAYTQDQVIPDEDVVSLRQVGQFLNDGMKFVRNIDAVNEKLVASHRPDLVITDLAELEQPPSVVSMSEHPYSRFGSHMAFTGGARGVERWARLGHETAIPTFEDVLVLRKPKQLREQHRPNGGISRTPVFARALNVYPNQIAKLVVHAGSKKPHVPKKLVPELFAAYSILSHLVDVSDRGVANAAREVDPQYLYRR